MQSIEQIDNGDLVEYKEDETELDFNEYRFYCTRMEDFSYWIDTDNDTAFKVNFYKINQQNPFKG